MRVGRAGDKCKRLQIGSFSLINQKESCKYKSNLVNFLDEPIEKTLLKEKRENKRQKINQKSASGNKEKLDKNPVLERVVIPKKTQTLHDIFKKQKLNQ